MIGGPDHGQQSDTLGHGPACGPRAQNAGPARGRREFSVALADGSPFAAREFIAGKDAVTLATDILALDQAAFIALFRRSPIKRAKLAGLRRNAAVVLKNAGS